jgi:formylglycine-generating enzyme required for sulfatase activity
VDRSAPIAGGPELVLIPAATFERGSTPAQVQAAYGLCRQQAADCRLEIYQREQPRQAVSVSPFRLERTEVTNARMAAWLDTLNGVEVRDGWKVWHEGRLLLGIHPQFGGIEQRGGRFEPREGAARRPAVQVTWAGADAFCRAQGGRLPTEAEWERAARAGDGRTFPWGEAVPACATSVFGRTDGGACGALGQGAAEVGSAVEDRTPEGVFDLGGNVSEWVQDGFVERYPACDGECRDPVAADAALHVVRGGNWSLSAESTRAAGRSRAPTGTMAGNIGFRCAVDVPAADEQH